MAIRVPTGDGSNRQPVALRCRPDLVITQSVYQTQQSWIVKDPVSLRYCRLREPEYLVLQCLDTRTDLESIRQQLQGSFPEQDIRLDEVQRLIASLNRQGLLISAASGQADALLQRASKLRRQGRLKLLTSALALRLPGIDPEPLLNALYPRVRWFFSPSCVAVCGALMVAAAALIGLNFEAFSNRLPEFHRFFALQNILLMALVLVVTKSLHELGHGLACKHFGGECHQIGFMFLVLTPCMYCDTSDSWMLPNKWRRMAIGAAGMYVELVLAALCTFVWWNTHPGWLNFMALNVMFLCSVSTIVFNANPLLRYDGYYILADWLEVPNLAQKSRSAMLSKLRVWCLGLDPIPERFLPEHHRGLFAAYSVASFLYRWFVLIMILWFLSHVFAPWGLQVIGQMLIALSIVGMIGVPVWQLYQFFAYPGRMRQVNTRRMMWTGTILAGLAGLVFLVPFDYTIQAPLVVRPVDEQQVHVRMAGRLNQSLVRPGQTVAANQLLAQLENPAEQTRYLELLGSVARLEHEIAQLDRLADLDEVSTALVMRRRAELAGTRQQLDAQSERIRLLELRARKPGVVIPPPDIPPLPDNDELDADLAGMSGTPLDDVNQGAWLPADTWLCSIARDDQYEAVMLVSQKDVQLLRSGARGQLMLDEYPGRRLGVTVSQITTDSEVKVPRELTAAAGGPLPDDAPSSSDGRYMAIANLDDTAESLPLIRGYRGRARIHAGRFTLAWRIQRFVSTVFNGGGGP